MNDVTQKFLTVKRNTHILGDASYMAAKSISSNRTQTRKKAVGLPTSNSNTKLRKAKAVAHTRRTSERPTDWRFDVSFTGERKVLHVVLRRVIQTFKKFGIPICAAYAAKAKWRSTFDL
jgi:hypothetical protein